MTNLKLFLRDGKWYGNSFPEEPPMSNQFAHEAAVEKAKSEALEVVNPEAYGFFKYEDNWLIDVGCAPITDVRPIKDGVLYPWDGGWEIEYQFFGSTINSNHWIKCTAEEHAHYVHLCETRKFLRLLPKAAVTEPKDVAPVNDAGNETVLKLFRKHRKMNWTNEYAEHGIVNFDGLKSIISELAQPSPQAESQATLFLELWFLCQEIEDEEIWNDHVQKMYHITRKI